MKLTPGQLKRIIAEEVSRTLSEAPPGRRGVGYDFRSPQGGTGNTGYREPGFEGGTPAPLVHNPAGTQPAPLPPPPQSPTPGVKKTYQLDSIEKRVDGCDLKVFSYERGEKVYRVVPLDKRECDQLVGAIKVAIKNAPARYGKLDSRINKDIALAINPYLTALGGTISGITDLYQKFKEVGLI